MSRLRLRHCLLAWVIIGLGFIMPATKPVMDPDIWWHIRAGELIVKNLSVPRTDLFSFTSMGQPWVLSSWLSEVIFYGIFRWFKYFGLILTVSVCISTTFLGIFLLARRKVASDMMRIVVVIVCGLGTWLFWSPRPHLFTFMLLPAMLLLLERPLNKRKLWLLVPLFWAWSNLHAAWIYGFAIMTIILLEAVIEAMQTGQKSEVVGLTLIYVCSFLAMFAGPTPLTRLSAPLGYPGNVIPVHIIQEFKSPNFGNWQMFPFEALVLGLGSLLYFGRRPMRVSEWFVLLVALHYALKHGRHVPLFAIVAAPIVAMQLQGVLERLNKEKKEADVKREISEHWLVSLALLAMIPVVFFSLALPRKINDEAHMVPGYIYPLGAASFLQNQPRIGEGRLLNPYNWGGYLIFRLYPKYLVSMDGRADVHKIEWLQYLDALENLSPNWERYLKRYNPDVIVWSPQMPLAIILRSEPDWRIVYEDKTAVVFVRRG